MNLTVSKGYNLLQYPVPIFVPFASVPYFELSSSTASIALDTSQKLNQSDYYIDGTDAFKLSNSYEINFQMRFYAKSVCKAK